MQPPHKLEISLDYIPAKLFSGYKHPVKTIPAELLKYTTPPLNNGKLPTLKGGRLIPVSLITRSKKNCK
jgi:hypothetical protein